MKFFVLKNDISISRLLQRTFLIVMLFPIYFFYSFRDYTYQAHKRLVYEKVPKIKGIEFGIDSKTRSEGRRLGVEGR